MTRRRLREEELALWQTVVRNAEPLHSDSLPDAQKDSPATKTKTTHKTPGEPVPQFEIGSRSKNNTSHDIAFSITDQVSNVPVSMDFKTYKKMRRGKMKPEGRIDLHGMTVARARPALASFILSSQAQGKRLVLVITGKGRLREDDGPIPSRIGVLRHEVPHWLSLPPLQSCVQQITPASRNHGGTGAYYVYLRRM